MLPSSAKNKGRMFQNWVRKLILSTFLELEPDDVKSTSMGAGGEDVLLSPAARRAFPYQVECKSKATSQIHTYYDQAQSHGKHEAVVFVKMNNKKPLAVVDAEHFVKLIKEINTLKNANQRND